MLTAAQAELIRSDRQTDEPGSCRRGASRHHTVDGSISISISIETILSDNPGRQSYKHHRSSEAVAVVP